MFSSPKTPAPDADLGGMQPQQVATIEQARPLPWFCGTARLPSVFLTDALQVKTVPVESKQGKGSSTIGQSVYAKFGLAHARGPVDKIWKIFCDNKAEWVGEVTRGSGPSAHYYDLLITTRAQIRFYWGTATQPAETGTGSLSDWDGYIHPAYRGQFYSVWGRDAAGGGAFLGNNRDAVFSVEEIVSRWPCPSWWTAAGADGTYPTRIGQDINPAAAIADLLQDTVAGIGLADARIDATSFNAVGAILVTEGLGISPVLDRQQSLRQALADMLACIDGYFFYTSDGKIGLGLIRTPGGGLTTIDETVATGAPALEPRAWADTTNGLTLVFKNAARDYLEEPVYFVDRGNYQVTGINRTQTVRRPHITVEGTALKVAIALGARNGLPGLAGTIPVRKSVGKTLKPGTAFLLTCAEQGLNGMVARVMEQTYPGPKDAPVVKLGWQLDRSNLNTSGYAAAAEPVPPAGITLGPATQRVIEWPWVRDEGVPQVAMLLRREYAEASGFFAHVERPSGSYDLLGWTPFYALHGAIVDANYPMTNVIDDALGMVVLLDGSETTFSDTGEPLSDGLLNEWLVVVGDEICSAFNVTLLAAGKYRLHLVRERFDTVRAAHAIGAEVWIFKRTQAALFKAWDELETQTFKLQQAVAGELEDIAGVTPVALTTSGRFWRPLEPRGLTANGDCHAPVYSTGADVALTWAIRSERMAGFWEVWEGGWTEDLADTVLEFWTIGGVEPAGSVYITPDRDSAAPMNSYVLTNANLAAWLGAEVTFEVRAYARRDGYRSTRYSSLVVTKI